MERKDRELAVTQSTEHHARSIKEPEDGVCST